MMFDVLLITTNHPKRFDTLTKTINSIDKQLSQSGYSEVNKILSVDEFDYVKTDFDFFENKSKSDWKVVFGPCSGRNGMAMNQMRGLDYIKKEWVLYSEDDVTFKKIIQMDCISEILGNKTGFISVQGSVNSQSPNSDTLKYINDSKNYFYLGSDIFLKKNPNIFLKKWYLNFPSCYIRKEHLVKMLKFALDNFANQPVSIEEGLSRAWFAYNLHAITESYCHLVEMPNFSKNITLQDIHNLAALNYWNNDPSTRIEPINNKQSMWF